MFKLVYTKIKFDRPKGHNGKKFSRKERRLLYIVHLGVINLHGIHRPTYSGYGGDSCLGAWFLNDLSVKQPELVGISRISS